MNAHTTIVFVGAGGYVV